MHLLACQKRRGFRTWCKCRKNPNFHNSVLRVAYCSHRLLSALDRPITLLLLLCSSTTIQCMCKTFEEGRLAVIMAPDRAIDYVLELKSKALLFLWWRNMIACLPSCSSTKCIRHENIKVTRMLKVKHILECSNYIILGSQGKLKNWLVLMVSFLAEEQSAMFQREHHNFSGIGKIQAWNFTLQRVQTVIWGFLENAGKTTGYINVSVYKDYFK